MQTTYSGSYQSENAPLFVSQPPSLDAGSTPYDDNADENAADSKFSMRSVVFGALDGLTTSLAVLGAAAGCGVGSSVVLALGVASIAADAIALGFGEYLSSKAHMTFVQAQRRHGHKGMSKADAEIVVNTMAQYENLFVNLMITEERAFAFFGSLPLLTYWICDALLVTSDTHAFLIAVFAGLAMLAAFGCIKGSFSTGIISLGGIEPLIIGASCSAIAFVLGNLLSDFASIN